MPNNDDVLVSRITVSPVQSLDGVLEFDRRWAMIDAQGDFVNAKQG